ncbi:unnamed protein product, partial [marine sediment metagenome]
EKTLTPGYSNIAESVCNPELNIEITNEIVNSGESVKYRPYLNQPYAGYEITYWIEDLFGNIKRSPHTSINMNERSWTKSIRNNEKKAYIIKANATVDCTNEIFYANKSVIIVGDEPEEDSELEIGTVYLGSDNKARWGDTLRVKVRVYKGEDTKYAVYFYLDDNISK